MNKIKKFNIALMIMFVSILFLSIKAYATTGRVNENVVYIRKSATKDSNVLAYVTKDDKVDVIEKDGDWYKIKYKNTTGYIYAQYINVDESKVEPAKVETTSSSKTEVEESVNKVDLDIYIEKETNINIIPNSISTIIYTADENKEIFVIEAMGEWAYVKVEDRINGWVKSNKIKEKNPVETDVKEESTEPEETAKVEEKEEANDSTVEEEKSESKETKKSAYIAYDMVNLREKPSTSSKSLAKLKLNDEVWVIKEENSTWTKVEYEDMTGFISTSLLSNNKVYKKEEKEESTTTSRSGEESARQIAEKIEEEEKKENTKQEETQKDTVKDNNEDKNTNKTSGKVTGQQIADYAQKFLGYKYVYGGASPSGFDCSGFTSYVYKQFGYSLSRSASGQASNGKKVDKSDLKPGDLVIFKNHALTKIGHVGIYIGNNKMIHASEPGVGVIITDIDSKAYKYPQRYVTARRIIN